MSSSPGTTAHLLRQAASHDEGAARAFVAALGPLVQRIIAAHEPLRREMEDLTQDVFFRVFRSASAYRADAPVEHWVARIAKCVCIDRLRRMKARPELILTDLSEAQRALLRRQDMAAEPLVSAGEEARELLEKLFATLLPVDAWLLREVELRQRTLTEVGTEAGWNATLTRVRLFRARTRLRTAFEKLNSSHSSQP